MKTAVEYFIERSPNLRDIPPYIAISLDDYKCIQSDALAIGRIEGAKKAERIAQLTADRSHAESDINYRSGLRWMRDEIVMNISTAIEKSEI